jgi:single-strand DNA-binding protein
MTVNLVNLVGRVGGDPDLKVFDSGNMKCRLTLAVNRRSKNKDEPPDWFNLELWGQTAQIAADYVRKGSLIGVSGALKLDYWQDRSTGADRSSPTIRVERMEFLGSKRDNEAAGNSMNGSGFDEGF